MTTEPQTIEEMAEGLLMPEAEVAAPDEDQTDTDEATEETTEDEAPEVEAEADAEGDETEDGENVDDSDETEAEEQPQTFKVKVDGEETEVTLEELTRGYAGQSYIQKGMEENSRLRKQTEETYNAMAQQRQQLEALVRHLSTNGLRAPVAPDIATLQSDPIGYMEAKAQYDNEQAEYNQTVQAIQQQQAQAHAADQQARAAYLQEQKEALSRAIPDFLDPEKGTALQKRIRATGIEYGFAEQELAGVTDARHVQVLHDAMRYREMMAKKGEVTAKAAKARPVVKASAKATKAPATVEREKQRKKFQQSGRIEDALNLMFE